MRQKLLVASTPDGQYIAQHALSDIYDLQFASTIREAEELLSSYEKGEISMILAGVHFDESRMIELLQFVRTQDHFDDLPFLAFQAVPSAIKMEATVGDMAKKLGCCDFVRLHSMPHSRAKKVLQEAVKRGLNKPVKAMRIDKTD